MSFTLDPQLQLGYTQLRVMDIQKQTAFYETLGFQILEQSMERVVLGAGSNEPVLILVHEENSIPRPPRTTGLFHFAILVKSKEDLGHVIGNLTQRGIRFTGAGDHLYSEAFYLNDPKAMALKFTTTARATNGQSMKMAQLIPIHSLLTCKQF